MKIYICHATSFNYQTELYYPLKSSTLWQQHTFILPHEVSVIPSHSKFLIADSDLIVAEVSYASTGLGIELGWADIARRPILCCYHQDYIPSSSLKLLTQAFIAYKDQRDLIEQLINWFKVQQENNT